jgi:hypothetical protein
MSGKEMSTVKYLALVFLALTIALSVFIVVKAMPNYKGYCEIERRYLSEDEKLNIAIKSILATYPPVIDIYEMRGDAQAKVDVNIPKNPLYYKSVEEFLEVNQNCCKQSFDEIDYIDNVLIFRAMGKLSSIFNIRYKVRYFNDIGDVSVQYSERTIAITNCGRAWYP